MGGLGILGGTFNPPHCGHLACARHAYQELGLASVLLMPTGVPPHKQVGQDPGPAHRLRMSRLAVDGDDRLRASSLEIERAGPSYTVDTLRALHASDRSVDLTFIVGADMALTLPQWREPRELLALARVAVAERKGVRREEIRGVLDTLADSERVVFLKMPTLDVSSSMVRDLVARRRPLDGLVPGAVARYIATHGLYQRSDAGATPSRPPEVIER